MKQRINISLDEETANKLKELAMTTHRNVSQWISEKVWEEAGKEESKKIRRLRDAGITQPNDVCWETGNYTDCCDCELCEHKHECSGYEKDDDD